MKKDIRYVSLLIVLYLNMNGCQIIGDRPAPFSLNPPDNKPYQYSTLLVSEVFNKYPSSDSAGNAGNNRSIDTIQVDFSLEQISRVDSLVRFRLTFLEFYKNKKPFKFSIRQTGKAAAFIFKDPFALYDSIRKAIPGKTVTIVITNKGDVKEVRGVEQITRALSVMMNEPESQVQRSGSDYLSINAITDLIHRFLSVVPGREVKEGKNWVRNVTLNTKAPVKLSQIYTLDQLENDTAILTVRSIISAEQSEGGTVYMKGRGDGRAKVNFNTGMPYFYETIAEMETSTSNHQYDYIRKEHFIVKERK